MIKEEINKLINIKKELTGYASIDRPHEKDSTFFEKNPIIPNTSVYNAMKLMSTPYKNDVSLDCLDLQVKYTELFNNSKIISKSFKELGIKKGDIISVAMPNYSQAVAVYLAANRIGATVTFLNAYSSKEELKHYLNTFESKLFINYDKDREYNKDIKKDTKVEQIITLNKENLNSKTFADSSHKIVGYDDFISFNDLQVIGDYYKNFIYTGYGSKENSLILFTSGSTGNPKSVVLTNENILASGMYMKNSTHLSDTRGEKSLVCVPFSYPYGFATSTLMSLLCGRSAILGPNLSKENVSYFLKKNPNVVFGSPALLELIMRNVPENQDLSSINTFISGGDFLQPKTIESGNEFFKQHNAKVNICNGSGNAETVGASTNSVGIEYKEGTVGKVLVGSNPIIINPLTNEELKYGEEGLLCISGKHVFKEYYKDPQTTEEAKFFHNGKTYLKTGTRGFLDEDGYFHLTGRDSRYYIMSTLNKVYCDHVQSVMTGIDEIDSCAVVQKPDSELLFVNKAYIVLKNGVVSSEKLKEEILDKCAGPIKVLGNESFQQLKPYEIPSSIEFVDSLPRTKADKIDYETLKKDAESEFENTNIKKYIKK